MEIEVINEVRWERDRYASGQLMYEEPCVNGQRHGLVRWWRSNGKLWYESSYVNGQRHGLCRGWYENGQLRYVRLWNNNRLVFEIENPPKKPGIWKLK